MLVTDLECRYLIVRTFDINEHLERELVFGHGIDTVLRDVLLDETTLKDTSRQRGDDRVLRHLIANYKQQHINTGVKVQIYLN